ncbi:MAG TPA: NADH-quinone oxidoreductase subunit J, partial [Anaerolineales bacterium]|nr:NADH-quinone oxidoreductase subunit J [Anaerolineales bacterium]
MTLDLALFLILSLIAVASALGMLLSRNAVYSALFLVLNFVTVAVFYLLLGAPFIAMAQITVYAGAIMVLFLFVIMLLGAESLTGISNLRKILFPGVLAVILFVEAAYLLIV